VIASDLPTMREAFGEHGIVLVTHNDAEAWRNAIERMLNRYPEALTRCDGAAKIVRDRYSLESMVSKHAHLYRRFLKATL